MELSYWALKMEGVGGEEQRINGKIDSLGESISPSLPYVSPPVHLGPRDQDNSGHPHHRNGQVGLEVKVMPSLS